MKPIPIIVVTYLREETTLNTLRLLKRHTSTPHRIILVDNGSSCIWDKAHPELIYKYYAMSENVGLERARNIGMNHIDKDDEFVIHMDNDIFVPDLKPDWIQQLLSLMEKYPQYAAIALRPQVLVGVGPIFKTEDEVVENNVVGGVGRLMRVSAIKQVGGWDEAIRNEGRGTEEWDICGKLRNAGWKVGYARNLWAYHQFIDSNWGYPEGMKFGRVLKEAPKDVEFNPVTMEPSLKSNQ